MSSPRNDVLAWLLEGDPSIRWQVMRDLQGADAGAVAAERSRVAHEGWGARLLELQWDDGSWDGGACFPSPFSEALYEREGQPWTATYPTLSLLCQLGVDPADPAVSAAVTRAGDGVRWEEGGQAFFDGEVEPCINGRTVAIATYFGRDATPIVERLLTERLTDGGWNCEAPHASSVSSFDTTVNVLEGLAAYGAAGGRVPVDAALRGGEEYLLERRMFRRRTTGEVAHPGYLRLAFPSQWHYDILRGLDHLRVASRAPDPRAAEAIDVLSSKQRDDGRWDLDRAHAGRMHFPLEEVGEPSRWITLRALRVLEWWESGTRERA
ncbi:hypothetical protein [Demequina muriae]|uniref:Squalene cyclase n=1 Tax=Demequina muriae TaxID=3051664 RepID=A0ABT8GIP9_9MICO|nr:hypothetical protein [Demequina sp. EGI L300058]MDN4481290.1 hypothetical protein [Demequina sp. EGI L300058]